MYRFWKVIFSRTLCNLLNITVRQEEIVPKHIFISSSSNIRMALPPELGKKSCRFFPVKEKIFQEIKIIDLDRIPNKNLEPFINDHFFGYIYMFEFKFKRLKMNKIEKAN